jgi:hypothetical protein
MIKRFFCAMVLVATSVTAAVAHDDSGDKSKVTLV